MAKEDRIVHIIELRPDRANDIGFITKPGVMINKERTAVGITGEALHPVTKKRTGITIRLQMQTPDAMSLLGAMMAMQKKFDLKLPEGEPEHIDVPPERQKH